ncbi:MAG TPA: hypothetical protein VMB50_00920 [Myxococcales bacterium]|nr:hypothetical protein [Myxococcales bacterium]
MRRFTLAVSTSLVTLAFGFAGCNDGPNQTYSPPAPNATWNDGRAAPGDGGLPTVPGGTATSATAPFAADGGGALGSGGQNSNEICTPAEIAVQNGVLNNEPILAPNQVAGLNIAGADGQGGTTWQGLTIEQAESRPNLGTAITSGPGITSADPFIPNAGGNCQGTPESDLFGQANYLSVYWNGGSVTAEYYVPTHKIDYLGIGPGLGGQYQGTLTMTSLDGSTTYTVAVDGVTPIYVLDNTTGTNTAVPNLDWLGASQGVPASMAIFDSMYRAAMATFFPGYPTEPAGQTCNQTGACIIGTFPSGNYAYFAIQPLGIALWVNPYTFGTITSNAINRIDVNFAQIMNFSSANPVLKLDNVGPTTIPFSTPSGQTCALSLGMSYGDFLNDCVATSTDASANTTEQLELFSNLSHDEETIQFNIVGVDMSFSAIDRLGYATPANPPQVLVDAPLSGCATAANEGAAGCPQPADQSFEMNVDQYTLGLLANDWSYSTDANGNVVAQYQTLAGAGALYDDYRTLSIGAIESEVCSNSPTNPNCAVWIPADPDGGTPAPPTLAQQIQSCIAPRDSSGNLETTSWFNANVGAAYVAGIPGVLPVGCTGMEQLLSADITPKSDGTPNYDDPVDIGPIVSQIDPNYTLGMKMGHQTGAWCIDAMSLNQIGAQSVVTLGDGTTQPMTGKEVVDLAEQGPAGVQADFNDPAATVTTLTLPQFCVENNILPQSELQVIAAVAGGNQALLPLDMQGGAGGTPSARFFFKQYGYATIQTLEASTGVGSFGPNGSISMPVSEWGPPTVGSPMPIQLNDLFFDSLGDGQFETFEYVDRRFVCPDGANDCAPAPLPQGAPTPPAFTCPAGTCDMSVASNHCPAPVANGIVPQVPLCNPNETAQPPTDVTFTADVKDGIMDAYDVNRYLYRGETALYTSIQPQGFAVAQASNALFTNVWGSALLNSFGPGAAGIDGLPDLTGAIIHASDYAGAIAYASTGVGTPLTLSYTQAPTSALTVDGTYAGPQQILLNYEVPDGGFPGVGGATPWTEMVDWTPNQPLNGFDVADYGNSMLDYFVQTASADFTGITVTGLLDYNIVNGGMEEMAAESTDFLGDVFMCYEPAANPPILAVRMYTPTQAVLNWLNSVPQAYADCGIVVRWSPYDTFVNLIDSTLYGVRLQVTQGGGLGRIVGAQVYVPNLPFEE